MAAFGQQVFSNPSMESMEMYTGFTNPDLYTAMLRGGYSYPERAGVRGTSTPDPLKYGNFMGGAQKKPAATMVDEAPTPPMFDSSNCDFMLSTAELQRKLHDVKLLQEDAHSRVGVQIPEAFDVPFPVQLQKDEFSMWPPVPPQPGMDWDQKAPTRPAGMKKILSRNSVGSIGHPHSCAPACKYVKRKTGCRDGAACQQCHQCFWQRDKQVLKKVKPPPGLEALSEAAEPMTIDISMSPSFAPQVLQESGYIITPENAPSVGTIGHPYTCARGCKYFAKPRQCKDGYDCPRCHLCTWSRYKDGKTKDMTLDQDAKFLPRGLLTPSDTEDYNLEEANVSKIYM
jgi:hypothetical protein